MSRWFVPGLLAPLLAAAAPLQAQQLPDTLYAPPIARPAHAPGSGPIVAIDEAHGNFHTVDGRFRPFAALLRRDGYRLEAFAAPLSRAALAGVDLLVVANPLHERNLTDWTLPTPPAYTPEEARALAEWVREGGSLLLIADHMPFPGGAAPLLAAFGAEFRNGFTGIGDDVGPITFRRAASATGGSLASHPILDGRHPGEGIDSVVSFTGTAFRPGPFGRPLMVLPADARSLEPATAWAFDAGTPVVPVGGWCQGAALEFGEGRVALFAEAAMFTAQLAGPQAVKMGMNSIEAPQNFQFLLNTTHWLTESRE